MNFSQRNAFLNHFFFLAYLIILLVTAPYLKRTGLFDAAPAALFVLTVYLSYGFIYLLPALVITKFVHHILAWRKKNRDLSPAAARIVYTLAVALTAVTIILLFVDTRIFEIFGFHINGFVLNLVTTPGGIESMGGDNATTIYFTLAILGFIILQIFLCRGLFLISARKPFTWIRRPRKLYRYLLLIFLLCTAGERVAYGLSSIKGYSPVLISSQAFPGYLPCTFRSLAKKLGVKDNSRNNLKVKLSDTALNYPLEKLRIETPARPLNVVWLVAESWRWDMLDPEITPAAWEFSQRSHHFLNHYSGGNGTRMGLFSMFYGLYGPYWFDFLNTRRSPVIMDVLQQQKYQMSMYTSARFSYPEFDKTLFVSIPRDSLHDHNTGQGWQRDRENVTDLIQYIKKRDQKRPFMTFMFFESPHARYYFPEESILRKEYLQDFNYATMNLEKDIELIKNRYINSCHHLDSQFARIIEFLEREDLLNNTIVILTGDHGEEFMEKGRWGHGSTFVEEQIKTPFVLWIPNTGNGSVEKLTSHLDIASTLLPFLGVTNPPEDYSLGFNLLGDQQRPYNIISDWSRICYADPHYKMSIPLKAAGAFKNDLNTKDDVPVRDNEEFMKKHQKTLVKVMRELNRFKQK
jgi:uncharacterized protein